MERLGVLPHPASVVGEHLDVALVAAIEEYGTVLATPMILVYQVTLRECVAIGPAEVIDCLVEPFGFVIDLVAQFGVLARRWLVRGQRAEDGARADEQRRPNAQEYQCQLEHPLAAINWRGEV